MSDDGNSSSGCGSEIGVSIKPFQEGKVVVELGLNLQNQDRPFQSGKSTSAADDQDDDEGPTCNGHSDMMKRSDICDAVGVHSSYPVNSYSAAPGFVRDLQPSDVSYSSVHPFFRPSGGMATTAMGFPFTAAQWKELERQAMIYKYMMASLPVPPDLLYSSFPTNISSASCTFAPTSFFVGKYGNGVNLKWVGNSKDLEPGRCRRTDGKKWRCSRDVAPNQKYCERHMHRGRPRSRKPVELHNPPPNLPANTKINNTNTLKKTRLNDSTTQTVASSFPSVHLPKASTFDHTTVPSANPFEDSRTLAWAEEQQWLQLMQTNMNLSVYQNEFGGIPLNLNSHGDSNSKSDMGLLERPLIDACSMGLTGNKFNGGQGNATDKDMCQIHMGLGVIDSPGGPLAEVLRPATSPTGMGSIPATADGSEVDFVTPTETAVSSPSGVLQKTHAAFSDSSESSSPTYQHSKAKSDVPFHWLN